MKNQNELSFILLRYDCTILNSGNHWQITLFKNFNKLFFVGTSIEKLFEKVEDHLRYRPSVNPTTEDELYQDTKQAIFNFFRGNNV
jgi:hypothetical protein